MMSRAATGTSAAVTKRVVDVFVPEDAQPMDLLVFKHTPGSDENVLIAVPEDACPGAVIAVMLPVGQGVHDLRVIKEREVRSLTEDQIMQGFVDLKPTVGKPLDQLMLLVFRAPPPIAGESLRICFDSWELVEVNGVPQPSAYAFAPPGSSYEEFFLYNNIELPGFLAPAALRADLSSAAAPPGAPASSAPRTLQRILRMRHKQTRSVCASRLPAWRDGLRWRTREEDAWTFLCYHKMRNARVGPRRE